MSLISKFNQWSNIFTVTISILALAFSIATYFQSSQFAFEKVKFHINLTNSIAKKTIHICKTKRTKYGAKLCKNFIKETKNQIDQLNGAIKSEAQHMSVQDYESSTLSMQAARSSITEAQWYLAGTKNKLNHTND